MAKRYIRLLSFNNALKVIDFVKTKGGSSTIFTGAIEVDIEEKYMESISDFLQSMSVSYEFSTEYPYNPNKIYDNIQLYPSQRIDTLDPFNCPLMIGDEVEVLDPQDPFKKGDKLIVFTYFYSGVDKNFVLKNQEQIFVKNRNAYAIIPRTKIKLLRRPMV